LDSFIKQKVENKIISLTKKLEGVLKITSDQFQKKRVSIQLAQLKKDMKRLEAGNFSESEVKKYLDEEDMKLSFAEEEKSRLSEYEILNEIPQLQASPDCNEPEINEIYSFLSYFENEYWGAISDFQFKLDFNYSQKRDQFFNELNIVQMGLKNYLDVLHDLSGDVVTREYEEKLKIMRTKQYMDVVMKTGTFIKKLYNFVDTLLTDFSDGGNIILNPDDVLNFDHLEGDNLLEGATIIEGLKSLHQFAAEFIEYLSIPELKKIKRFDDRYMDE